MRRQRRHTSGGRRERLTHREHNAKLSLAFRFVICGHSESGLPNRKTEKAQWQIFCHCQWWTSCTSTGGSLLRSQVSRLELLLLHLPVGIIVDESDAELDAGGSEDVAAPGGPWAVWLWPCEDVAAPGGGGGYVVVAGGGIGGGGGAWRYNTSGRF